MSVVDIAILSVIDKSMRVVFRIYFLFNFSTCNIQWRGFCLRENTGTALYNNDITMVIIVIIDNHNHDNGNRNNDFTMIIMLTAITTVTKREYFQMEFFDSA